MTRGRRWRALVGASAALLATLGLAGCGSSGDADADATVRVVASTDVWGDVVEQVAGDLAGSTVAVTSIITGAATDPHSYQASTQDQLAISKADVVVENGGGYDDFVGTMMTSSGDPQAIVIDAVRVSGYAASAGDELNEHVWYDVPTVRAVAAQIAHGLATADPGDRSTYQANLDAFDAKLATLQASEASMKAAHDGAGVAVTEPVPLYLLTACGLVDRTPPEFSEAIENGTDVSASVLKDTESLFDDGQVSLLIYNQQTSGAETDAVRAAAERNDIPVVPVTETLPDGQDYVSWMQGNLDAVGSALGAGPT